MSRMIELIRQSAVPANTMRTAARGALELPAGEMIEILVYLTSTAIFGEQAKMTQASWDEASASKVAGEPQTTWEVLAYMVAPPHLRPKLAPALLDNPSIREAALVEMAQNASRELITMILQSGRCGRSQSILHSLLSNPALSEAESRQVRENLRSLGEETTRIQAYQEADTRQEQKSQYEIDHAAEIAAEEAEAKPFSLIGQEEESFEDLEELEPVAPAEDAPPPAPALVPEFEVVPSAGNPRCPLDLSLSLMNHLLINDLKALSMNKNIPETLRKLALKKFKEKSEKKHGG